MWLRLGSENLWVIISAVSWGLACFPAVSGTGKGRQYRDVIREVGESRWKYQVQVAKQCAWPCQTGSALLWGWEGSEPDRLCLGPAALAEGEAKGCPSIPECYFQALVAIAVSRVPSVSLPRPLALEVSFVACPKPRPVEHRERRKVISYKLGFLGRAKAQDSLWNLRPIPSEWGIWLLLCWGLPLPGCLPGRHRHNEGNPGRLGSCKPGACPLPQRIHGQSLGNGEWGPRAAARPGECSAGKLRLCFQVGCPSQALVKDTQPGECQQCLGTCGVELFSSGNPFVESWG